MAYAAHELEFGPRAQRPLYFLHIPNCGGTSFSTFMERLGHSRRGLLENHNMPGGAGDSWRLSLESTDRRRNCDDVAAWARDRDIRFFATEAAYPFAPGTVPCSERFDHAVLICEPLKRLFSRAFRLVDVNRTVRRLLEATIIDDPRKGHTLVRRLMPSFAGTPSLNNPMLRQLLGPAAFRLPLGGIKSEHLEEALARLRNYTLVVPTPWLADARLARFLWSRYCRAPAGSLAGSTPAHEAAHEAASCSLVRARVPPMPHLNSKRRLLPDGAALEAAVWHLLARHNAWDRLLYERVLDEQRGRPPWDE